MRHQPVFKLHPVQLPVEPPLESVHCILFYTQSKLTAKMLLSQFVLSRTIRPNCKFRVCTTTNLSCVSLR